MKTILLSVLGLGFLVLGCKKESVQNRTTSSDTTVLADSTIIGTTSIPSVTTDTSAVDSADTALSAKN